MLPGPVDDLNVLGLSKFAPAGLLVDKCRRYSLARQDNRDGFKRRASDAVVSFVTQANLRK